MTDRPVTRPAASSRSQPSATALLGGLSSLAGRSYRTSAEATEAILKLIAAQLGMRTTYLSRINRASDDLLVRSSFNAPDGCDVVAGSTFDLQDTY